MAGRYLVIIGPAGNERNALATLVRAGARLTEMLTTDQMMVFTTPGTPTVELPDQAGVILGRVFASNDCRSVSEVSPDEAQLLVDSDGQRLISDYWGGYVGVLQNNDGKSCVIRDPSGAMPCYSIWSQGMLVLASDARALADTHLLSPILDWAAVRRHLATGLRSDTTCLVGVNEVLPGFRLTVQGARSTVTPCWSPWDHVHPHEDFSDDALAAVLRAKIRDCTRALASRFRKIMVTVSGGLDSSIVAASLVDQDTPFVCMTMATGGADGDERPYARILAQALGTPLREAFYTHSDVGLARSQGIGLPRPMGWVFDQSYQTQVRRQAAEDGVDAVFGGSGGDNVFCYMQSVSPLLDRLQMQGWSRGLWSTSDDICQLTGASLWKVLRFAVGRRFSRRKPKFPTVQDNFLAGREAAYNGLSHPWLVVPPGVPPGKAAHVAMLVRALASLDSDLGAGGPPLIHPLLCQPIMEFCLRIPTWKWIAGGQNRALARRAFRDAIPSALLERRTKGGPDSFAIEFIEHNRTEILDLLETGLLVRHGVIEIIAAREILLNDRRIGPPDHVRIAQLVAAEAWAQDWCASSAHSSAA